MSNLKAEDREIILFLGTILHHCAHWMKTTLLARGMLALYSLIQLPFRYRRLRNHAAELLISRE